MVRSSRGNIHSAVRSITITWSPHHRSVEYPRWFHVSIIGGDCKRRAICPSKDLNEISRRHHSRCVCPPFLFGKKRPRTLPHNQRDIMHRYKVSTCSLKKTPIKRPGSKYLLWVFVNYVSKFKVSLCPRPKLIPFSALLFVSSGCFVTTACYVGGNNRKHTSRRDWAKGLTV